MDNMPTHSASDTQILKRLIRIARPYLGLILIIFVIGLLATPLTLLLPIPLKIVVDSVVNSAPLPGAIALILPDAVTGSKSSLLLTAVILQILVVLLVHAQQLVMYVLQTYTGQKLILRLRQMLFAHIQRLSFAFHDARGTADSIYRIQYDATSIQQILVYGSIAFISAAATLLAMIYVIFMLNMQLALIAFAVLPALYVISQRFTRKMRNRYKLVKKMESRVLGIVHEVMGAFRVVKAFNREASEEERFENQAEDTIRLHISLAYAESTYGLMVNGTVALGTAGVLYVGVRNILAGTLTLGELLMVLTYLTQLYDPLKTISRKLASLQKNMASAQRAFELLDEVPDVADKPDAIGIRRAAGDLEFRSVSFAYGNEPPVLEDISLHIPAGTRIGMAGKTGAGKTTLVSLLPRFYDPLRGAVLLDGRDLRDYKLDDLRNQFSIVLQDPVLFATSVRENIAYAKPKASQQEIEAAARAANAHEFIVGLPDGYDTLVGERGMRLSGGERQRISLARAFLKDAPILVLDEPTSSVDIKTEGLIMDAMERLMNGRTTLMIAHRLSTLDNCDQTVEIHEGRIAQIIPGKPQGAAT
jgi:ATP-binding cassette subfamily B protein